MIRDKSGSRKCCAAAVIACAVAVMWGCGPKPAMEGGSRIPRPGEPEITAFADRFEVSWETNRRKGEAISGYYVHYWREPSNEPPAVPTWTLLSLASDSIKKLNHDVYPGDNDPRTDVETATIDSLTMGERYGVMIRTVGTDSYSPYSEAAYAVARPSGTFELSARFSGGNEGFSLSRGAGVGAMSELNDLYLFESREGPVLASPSRLDPLLRASTFHDLGSDADYDGIVKVDAGNGRGQSRVALEAGGVIVVVTDEQRQAKLRVRSIDGGSGQLRVSLDYVYQPRMDEEGF